MLNRRSLITGLISLVGAPAIVRAGSLMPVKTMFHRQALTTEPWGKYDWRMASPEEIFGDIQEVIRQMLEQSAFLPPEQVCPREWRVGCR